MRGTEDLRSIYEQRVSIKVQMQGADEARLRRT